MGKFKKKYSDDKRIDFYEGDLTCIETMEKVLKPENNCDNIACIHLAALLSGYAEDNFDLGLKVNFHGTLNIMDRMKDLQKKLKKKLTYVYTSTDYVCCFNEKNKKSP